MEFLRKNKFIVIAFFLAIIIFAFYFIRNYRASKTVYISKLDDEYVDVPKTYKVNEYTRINVSEDTMARKYFSDFRSKAISTPDDSYYLIDSEYRKAKFSNVNDYKKYINSLNLASAKIVKYSVGSKNGYKIYTIYDNHNNYYAFKVEGVLQYTVYLDDYTVEIR